MFRPLCDPTTFKAVTADFKGLQDVLGEFQDGEVQAAALREFAEEMLRSAAPAPTHPAQRWGSWPPSSTNASGRPASKLIDHHMTHLGRSVARHIDHVVATARRMRVHEGSR